MALSKEQFTNALKRLVLSRMRILMKHSFYGLLLMHTKFKVEEECETAYTDGDYIVFGYYFLEELSDEELDFVMMHEILHIVLRHCNRFGKKDDNLFNIACDIVVNSNILKSNNFDRKSITINKYGESIHKTPNGDEGFHYTAEEVFLLLEEKKEKYKNQNKAENSFDDHSKWTLLSDENEGDKADDENQKWLNRVLAAKAAVEKQLEGKGTTAGSIPASIERLYKELTESKVDWRTLLQNFIQEEVNDYSFTPPDKRFSEFDFFLPDFNDTDAKVSDILFMVDTSGSVTDEMLNQAISEIKGAIDQYNGKLSGYLGFFDTKVTDPKPFDSVDEMKKIAPIGGGGTSFHVIFNYVNDKMIENKPKCIVILTDGYAEFPSKDIIDIPVLWLINNNEVTPPWGTVARIKWE